MEYKVINASFAEFNIQVALLLNEGWIPQGGVSVIREYITVPTTYYFQAFIRHIESNDNPNDQDEHDDPSDQADPS